MKQFLFVLLCTAGGLLTPALHAQSYQVVSLTNGGTITGTVKWTGPVPRIPSLAITKDAQICDPDNQKVRDLERLLIGPDGGVADTVVFLNNVSSGKAMELPQQRQFLDQKTCRYEPHILLVPASGNLAMKSSDATLHTVHMEGAASYNLPFPFPNQVISHEMTSPGLVTLKCNGGHTWMNAEMFVVSHPYYAVTDKSGRFTLSNVPPGEYTIVAWHEGWQVNGQEGAFDVLTERKLQRPVFSPPQTWEKKVRIEPQSTVAVNFTLSQK